MTSLIDFLNHGTLPFTGRAAELERLIGFWRGTFAATELRSMLVLGEGGIGKSRLLEEAIPHLLGSGGAVVHAKLYPEATASVIELVAQALWHPHAGRNLLSEEPKPELTSVLAGVRRLSRLRATLLVVEDIHLLKGAAVGELSMLLNALTDETLSVLFLARPVELESRGVLERFIVEELVLRGLDREECDGLWQQMTGAAGGAVLSTALHEASAGNPLALRTALRGVLKSDELERAGSIDLWVSRADADSLSRRLKQRVGLLSEGMTAHLDTTELSAAQQLALLGEVFDRTAAEVMLDDATSLIESLLFKGVVAIATEAMPYSSGPPDSVLRFTHTLLHRQLLEKGDPNIERLVAVIASCPLRSLTPFLVFVRSRMPDSSVDSGVLTEAFVRSLQSARYFGMKREERIATSAWMTAARIIMSRFGSWPPEEWELLVARLINLTIITNSQRGDIPAQNHWIRMYKEFSVAGLSEEFAGERLFALMVHVNSMSEVDIGSVWSESEQLVILHPSLVNSTIYAYLLGALLEWPVEDGSQVMVDTVRERVTAVVESGDATLRTRSFLRFVVAAQALDSTASEALPELLDTLLANLDQWLLTEDPYNHYAKLGYLIELGRTVEAQRLCRAIIHSLSDFHLPVLAAFVQSLALALDAGLGADRESIEAGFETGPEEGVNAPAARTDSLSGNGFLLTSFLLRGETKEAASFVRRIKFDLRSEPACKRILLFASESDVAALLELKTGSSRDRIDFERIISLLLSDRSGDSTEQVLLIRRVLQRPIVILTNLLENHAVIALAELGPRSGTALSTRGDLASDIHDALLRELEWLARPECGMYAYMTAILDSYPDHFTTRELSSWRSRIDQIRRKWEERSAAAAGDGRSTLSMFGAITLRSPDGNLQRFQGARARMLLAMMTINELLSDRLTPEEFCRLTAGGEAVDVEKARDVVKTTVHRLREQIGPEAILTDRSTPRLNPALVRVDLLDLHEQVERARTALKRNAPMQAHRSLMSALELAGGEVAFPSLFDDVIESAREDFEHSIRSTAIDLARSLMREDDMDHAAEVLKGACLAVHGDEELVAMLADVLKLCNRNTDSTRARLRLTDIGSEVG